MSTMPNLEAALSYLDKGLSILPLRPGDKKPFGRWKRWQEEPMPPSQAKNWWGGTDAGLGIITGVSDLVVLDVEPEHVRRFANEVSIPEGAACVETARGGLHLYFRGQARCQKLKLGEEPVGDVRGKGGYVVAPPTVTPNGAYEWLGDLELDTLPEVPEWATPLKPKARPNLAELPPPRYVCARSGGVRRWVPSWLLDAIERPIVRHTPSELDFRLCYEMIAYGAGYEEIEALFYTYRPGQLQKHGGSYLSNTFGAAWIRVEGEEKDAEEMTCFDVIVSRGGPGRSRSRVTFRFWSASGRKSHPLTVCMELGDGSYSAEWLHTCSVLGLSPDDSPFRVLHRKVKIVMHRGKPRRIVE